MERGLAARRIAAVTAAGRQLWHRVFPKGPLDVLRQVALLGIAWYAYRLSRGLIDNPQGAVVAFENARHLISLEQTLGLFQEPAIHDHFRDIGWLNDLAVLVYMNAQTVIVLGAMVFIYFVHNERFYFVRNMFMASMVIALLGYMLLPTAPPRFFPEYGFVDSVSQFAGVEHDDSVNVLFNPYAAVPSMHCCFAIFLGVTLCRVSKHRLTRVLWGAYPFLMTWVVVVTANHWIADALLGALTAAASAWIALWLARARPTAWAWQPGDPHVAA
jgi:hypothetical protein